MDSREMYQHFIEIKQQLEEIKELLLEELPEEEEEGHETIKIKKKEVRE